MIRRHVISFAHAFDGLAHAFQTQPNFRVHCAAIFAVFIAGSYFSLSQVEWLVISLTIVMVVVTELINTSIESVVDLLTEKHNLHAKHAKDVAAASVLLSAIGSIVIGLIIFIPKLIWPYSLACYSLHFLSPPV